MNKIKKKKTLLFQSPLMTDISSKKQRKSLKKKKNNADI